MSDQNENGRQAGDVVYHHEGGNLPAHGHHDAEVLAENRIQAYWRANLRLLLGLLAVWATVSFLLSILFVDELNAIHFFGFKLGFWWAHQGSILVFIVLIFAYAYLMRRIERRYGVDDDA